MSNTDPDLRDLIAAYLLRKQEAEKLKLGISKDTRPIIVKEEGYDPMDDIRERERKLDAENKKKIAEIRNKIKIPLTPAERSAYHSTPAREASARRQGELEQAEAEAKAKRQKEIDDILGL